MGLFDDDHYGAIADRVCWVLVVLPTVIFGLRIYCRLRSKPGQLGSLGIDDLIAFICIVILWVTQALIVVASSHGLGQHWNTLKPQEQILALKYNTVINAVINWAFSMPKFAIITLLRKLLSYGTKTTILFWSLALIGQTGILVTSIWCFKQCDPVEKNWNPALEGKCAPPVILTDIGYFSSSCSAFLDLFFSLYPVPLIMRLNLPLRNRITVSGILGFGAIACIVQIYKLSIMKQTFAIMATDPTFPIPYLNTMGITEASILNICASLPALGPLFRMFRERFGKKPVSRSSDDRTGSTLDGTRYSNRGRNGWGELRGSQSQEMGNHVAIQSSTPGIVISGLNAKSSSSIEMCRPMTWEQKAYHENIV